MRAKSFHNAHEVARDAGGIRDEPDALAVEEAEVFIEENFDAEFHGGESIGSLQKRWQVGLHGVRWRAAAQKKKPGLGGPASEKSLRLTAPA
jgi:hypothetical protein